MTRALERTDGKGIGRLTLEQLEIALAPFLRTTIDLDCSFKHDIQGQMDLKFLYTFLIKMRRVRISKGAANSPFGLAKLEYEDNSFKNISNPRHILKKTNDIQNFDGDGLKIRSSITSGFARSKIDKSSAVESVSRFLC